MPSIDFTHDELMVIKHQMQMELDDWEDYHTPEIYRLIVRIVDKITKMTDGA
jgi:hypothetical protein